MGNCPAYFGGNVEAEKYWVEKVKDINSGLYIKYDDHQSKWVVRHKDDRTGLDRMVLYVQDEEGKPIDLNMGVLRHLKNAVDWKLLGEFPDPEKMYAELIRQHNAAKAKKELERRGFIMADNREHKKEWKIALGDFVKGLSRETVKRVLEKEEMRKKRLIIT